MELVQNESDEKVKREIDMYKSNELEEGLTIWNFRIVKKEVNREVE